MKLLCISPYGNLEIWEYIWTQTYREKEFPEIQPAFSWYVERSSIFDNLSYTTMLEEGPNFYKREVIEEWEE